MHALESLIAYYNGCKKDDIYKEVIGGILKNIHEVESCSIYDLADKCYASTTTISRLSKKLGYKNFTNFKMELVNSVKNYHVYNRYVPFHEISKYGGECETYLALMQQQIQDFIKEIDYKFIDKMIDVIEKFKCIKFYTNGINFAEYHFQEDLIMAGHESKTLILHIDQLADIETLNNETLVISICPVVHESAMNINVMKAVKEKGAVLFLITDSNYYRPSEYADYVYSFDGFLSMVDDYRFAMFLNILSIQYRIKYVK